MARTEQGAPRAPKIEFLEKMIERLDEIINAGDSLGRISDPAAGKGESANTELQVDEIYEEALLVGWRDAFEWVAVFLENRRDYHKKRNTANKVEMQLLEDALKRAGVDTAKIRREAERAADDSIS
jgi:hypothetical protein